ncbi:E3 ubiquitin-protein ligase TRIM71-like [Dysidea avara]|uniref:E3 ubiquitin-protein ligase TRIM71-like n=1 Tax=Dysidea avara TaxID=196820 RepID=UPI0033223272
MILEKFTFSLSIVAPTLIVRINRDYIFAVDLYSCNIDHVKIMASGGGVEKEWRQIEEEITCSICGDLFTDPKTIPCLHTFCKRCIERSIESNKKMATIVCCPLCRAPLPQDGIASIPTNFTINRLVEIFKKRKESGQGSVTMKCGKCKKGAEAITWCMECRNPLCQKCNEFHENWEDFESHKTVPINEFLQNPKQALAGTPEKAEFCKLVAHSEQKLDLYCKTCSSLICRDCTLKDHPREKHDFDFIENVVDEEREKMKQVTAPLKQLLQRVRNGVKKIERCEKQVDIDSEANIEKIRATYGEVYKLLKQQEEETVGKVNTIKTSFKKTLAVQKEHAKFVESQLVSCNEFCHKIVTVNRTRQLLTYNKWIENRVDEVTKQVEHTSLDPECKPSDMIVICHHPVEFVNDSVCDVSSCLPHLPDCTVSGPVVISDPVKVTVILKDIFGSPVVNQSKDLEIHCNKEREFLQNTHIEEESRGQYHIWYNRKRKEDHSLSVYWRGLEVSHEEIKVLTNIRDYNKLKQEVKIIDKYGPTNKKLTRPYLLAKGSNNELIVRDSSTKQLVVFDEHFQYSHVIGGAGSGNGKFQYITGIAVDKKGYLYVADSSLHCIQKFKLNGEFISQFGSKGTANNQFQSPYGLVLSQSELLFVCDKYNHRIQVFTKEQFSYCFGRHGTQPGTFNELVDLTLNNSEDQLFITDCHNHQVQVFTTKGQFLKVFGDFTDVPFKLQRPIGIHYTLDGHLLISSNDTNCVLVFEEDGKFTSAIEGTYQGKKRFSGLCGVVMMDNGQIVIADNGGHRLVVF